MSIQYNGQNIKEMYYNGQKIKEAYYNGEKVFSSENVLFEGDITFSSENGFIYTLSQTYPAGSKITWTPALSFSGDFKIIGLGQSQQRESSTVTEFTASIAFNYLLYSSFSTTAQTFHIKIIAGA